MKQDQTPHPNDRSPAENRHPINNALRVRTLLAVAMFILFGMGILIYQLYALQLRDPESYRVGAAEQQLLDEELPATRGTIYSSTGEVLARSTTVWNIIADPSDCNPAFIAEASEKISELLGGSVSAESILEKLSDSESQYKVLARNVDLPTKDAILEYANTKRALTEGAPEEDWETVLNIYTEQSSIRSYPYNSFLSSVLGFTNADGEGMYGLEKSYEDVLAGTPGRSVSTKNALGYEVADSEADVHDPINGYNLNLTIDENVQQTVEKYLSQAMEEYSVMNRGTVIVMDVNTGAILSMATVEQFDPNDPYTIQDPDLAAVLADSTLTDEEIDLLQSRLGENEVADIVEDGMLGEDEYSVLQGYLREAQWKNKSVTELYFPGSVFKLITAAAALDSGLVDASQQYYCGGELTVNPGTEWEITYHCANGDVHGWQDMAGQLEESCNLYFIQLAETMSTQFFTDYYSAFGLYERTGIDLPYEAAGISKTKADMDQVITDLYSSSFGQSQKITPIQMATAVAAVVNGGYLLTPYVVGSITDDSGNVIEQTQTDIRRQVISEEVSAQLRTMMENNVGQGQDGYSCRNVYVAGYAIGGKSGTGEQLDRSKRSYDDDYHKQISFAAALPIDDPEYLVFAVLDDPRWTEDFASMIVAPMIGNIISEIAPYLGIPTDPDYVAPETVKVKNYVGNGWSTAQMELNKVGLKHQIIGSGSSITYQYPYASMEVPYGSTVYLYTEASAGTQTTVPDAVGKTGSFAQQMLQSSNLNVQIDGDPSGQVVSQNIAAGTSVEYGTIITLTTETTAADTADSAAPETESAGTEETGAEEEGTL